MRQILIDATLLINDIRRHRRPYGIARVSRAYLQHYFDEMLLMIHYRKGIIIFPKDISQKIGNLILQNNPLAFRKILKLVFLGMIKQEKLKDTSHYVLLKTDYSGCDALGYFKALKKHQIQLVPMIHDLIPLLYPEFVEQSFEQKMLFLFSQFLNDATGIMTVSEEGGKTLKAYLNTKNLPSPPIVGITLAPGFKPFPSASIRKIEGPYFVMIGPTDDNRKNHLLMLEIWRDLLKRLGTSTPKLMIIGSPCRSNQYPRKILELSSHLKEYVLECPCTDEELVDYLSYARALLFPTFAEGYGLPLVEALSLKVPAIVSDLSVFHEIAGHIPEYLHPLDGLGWMKMIEEYSNEHSELRLAQLQRMEGFQVPSWDKHFKEVEQFLAQIERAQFES